jgi:L-alanine-DL-glutamate epimerase-like enolase superfamily enzyme
VKAELLRLAENLNPYPSKFPEEPILKEEEEEYRYVAKWSYKLIPNYAVKGVKKN